MEYPTTQLDGTSSRSLEASVGSQRTGFIPTYSYTTLPAAYTYSMKNEMVLPTDHMFESSIIQTFGLPVITPPIISPCFRDYGVDTITFPSESHLEALALVYYGSTLVTLRVVPSLVSRTLLYLCSPCRLAAGTSAFISHLDYNPGTPLCWA